MKLGMIGLGRMGANMSRRLLKHGHEVVGYDTGSDIAQQMEAEGLRPAKSLADMVEQLSSPRVLWMMVPSGKPVEATLDELLPMLNKGDVIVDGGNSYFRETKERSARAKAVGVHYVDVGTSGGVWGLENGYCMMAGGSKEAIAVIEPACTALAPRDGFLHVGPEGAGHYVKMIHNGIEYGMMQAYAEGFSILNSCEYDIDLRAVSHLWNQGSVVRSWLLELAERMFAEDPKLDSLTAYVEDSGEGRWTVLESINLSVPAPVISLSLQARFRSRERNSFSDRVLAALRKQFGGHAVKKS